MATFFEEFEARLKNERDAKTPQTNPLAASPCVKVCSIDGDVCVGCGRTLRELQDYGSANEQARIVINSMAKRRLTKLANRVR
ncbi:DUF1289 domain-containing protein [Marinobacter salarius]|uniref:Fe-S protein n=1 Tax=Marinobacter salarius TaxID=1420917 RepID=A0A1W6KFR9_9GAMM|nr:DUF1289 domain-containing protein [Marinobacter salarius]ARM86172.1 hypothetical protein MARSALSMR5_04152 [Marinobacter salarius]